MLCIFLFKQNDTIMFCNNLKMSSFLLKFILFNNLYYYYYDSLILNENLKSFKMFILSLKKHFLFLSIGTY